MLKTYWTIQTINKWLEVQQLGYLTGNIDYIWEYFVEPYKWMMEQMTNRLPNYKGEYPVWLWTERPDLRKSGHLEKGEQGVLLKVVLDEGDVLLSEFQAWHFVLSHLYLNLDVEDDRMITADEIQKSWAAIFDLERLRNHDDWGPHLDLQGVTGKVLLEQIKLEKTFIAR